MDKYTKIKMLGKGSFGEAWIVQNNINNKLYVMKLINSLKVKLDKIHQEINALKTISGQYCGSNSYCFEEWFVVYGNNNETHYAIITNYLENSQELSKYIYNLDLPNILFIIKRLLEQLQKFHNSDLTHNDIKPENIIIQMNNQDTIKNCLFIDFGLGCIQDNCKYSGTIMYMAPEALQNIGKDATIYNLKRSDIFSLGIVFYRLLNGKFPYPNILDFNHDNPDIHSSYHYESKSKSELTSESLQKQNYIGSDIYRLFMFYKENILPPSNYSNSFINQDIIHKLNNIVNLMLTKDYTQRPDINQLINMFNDINILMIESKYPSNNILSQNKKLGSVYKTNFNLYTE